MPHSQQHLRTLLYIQRSHLTSGRILNLLLLRVWKIVRQRIYICLFFCLLLHLLLLPLISSNKFCDLHPQVWRWGVRALWWSGWRSRHAVHGIWVSPWLSQWGSENDRYPLRAVNSRYALMLTGGGAEGAKSLVELKTGNEYKREAQGKQKQTNGKR